MTLRANRAAFVSRAFVPHVLRDVAQRDCGATLFGRRHRQPFGIAPMGGVSLCAAGGDAAMARGAAGPGIPFILSGAAFTPLEQVVAEAPGLWFQPLLPPRLEDAAPLLDRARAAGVHALAITADIPVPGHREADIRNAFGHPLRLGPGLVLQAAARPGWLWRTGRHFRGGSPPLPNLAPAIGGAAAADGGAELRHDRGAASALARSAGDQRIEQACRTSDPVGERRARKIDAVPGVDARPAVEREIVALTLRCGMVHGRPMSPSNPNRRAATLTLLALATGGFAIGTTEFATMSLLPFVARGLHVDEPTAGHLISAYALGVVVGAPVLAVVSARMRRRRLLVVLMLLFAVGNALSAVAPSFGWMLVFRFLSGLPHGAYFGIAALVAAGTLGPERRTAAVGRVMLGLTVATIAGVPLANELGQWAGWRWGFAIVAALALLTAALIRLFAPDPPVMAGASPLRELGALRRRKVWLTLATGAIGFGGLFAVYAYLQSTLTQVTGMAPTATALIFALFGVGMTLGAVVVAPLADRHPARTATAMMLLSVAALALFPAAAWSVPTVALDVLAIGVATAYGTILQTRLMDVAGEAQALAAALHHSAFNVANAVGPLLGGLAIAAGWGWTSTGYVGAILALLGLAVWGVALWDARRSETTISRQRSTAAAELSV